MLFHFFSFEGQRTLHHRSNVLETVVLVNPSENTVSSEVCVETHIACHQVKSTINLTEGFKDVHKTAPEPCLTILPHLKQHSSLAMIVIEQNIFSQIFCLFKLFNNDGYI